MGAVLKIFHKADNLSQKEIYQWLMDLRSNFYSPTSNYSVSSIMKASYGGETYYFGGVNCENVEHGLSTHGEDGAIAAMVVALGRCAVITEGWVMAAPWSLLPDSDDPRVNIGGSCCGRCRQHISGFSNKNTVIHSVSLKGDMKSSTISDLLPQSFSFQDYSPEISADSVCRSDLQALGEDRVVAKLIRRDEQGEENIFEWLSSLEGIDYASKISQRAVLRLDNGAYVAGVRIEDAAFTGINAIQAALAVAQAEFGGFKVVALYGLSTARDIGILPEGTLQPFSLSAMQSLNEFISHGDAEVILFNGAGKRLSMTCEEAMRHAISFKSPYIEL